KMVTVPINLNFTKGYVTLEHADQTSVRDGDRLPRHTFHWHNIGFDGPVLPRERAYEFPDALTPAKDTLNGINIGYDVAPDTTAVGNTPYYNGLGMYTCCSAAAHSGYQFIDHLII